MTWTAEAVDALKQAPAVKGILPAIHQRWSPRAFDDRDVGPADLARLFEAARWAPSAYNEQPWRFLVARRGSSTHGRIVSALIPFNQLWASNAPLLILSVAKSRFSHDNSVNDYALYDLGAATALLVVQAAEFGLVAHQMGAFDHAAVRETLGIPAEYLIGAVIALGYLGEPSRLPDEKLIAQETTPRTRKPLDAFVFSTWGHPAGLG